MRDGWKLATIGDLVESADGVPVEAPWSHELLTVRLHALGLTPTGRTPNKTKGGRKHFVRRTGQILIGRQNYNRRCIGVVPESLDGYVTSNAISAFEARPGVDPVFAYLVMASEATAQAADLAMPGTGQREISIRGILGLPAPLPPLDEQRRIVDLIGALDDTIEAAEQAVGSNPYRRLLVAFAERYEHRKLGDVVSAAFAGGTPSRKRPEFYGGEIPWLKSGEVANDRILSTEESITEAGLAGSSARLVPAGATVVAMYGATRAQTGRLAITMTTNQAVLALIADTDVIRSELLMHSVRAVGRSLEARGAGAAQPNLSKGVVLAETIPVPPVEEQGFVCDALDAALSASRAAELTVESLRTLRSNLLTALLSGEHEIPSSYDEVAEELAA